MSFQLRLGGGSLLGTVMTRFRGPFAADGWAMGRLVDAMSDAQRSAKTRGGGAMYRALGGGAGALSESNSTKPFASFLDKKAAFPR